jgi:hypothetical protein
VYGDVGPRYPALICGDFNLDANDVRRQGPHSLDYMRMMDILSRELSSAADGFVVRDLAFEALGHHPVTYGDVATGEGPPRPREVLLTHPADHCCKLSIDYALFLGPPADSRASLRHVGTSIEPFFCEANEAGPCTQLSDHYGVTSLFELEEIH